MLSCAAGVCSDAMCQSSANAVFTQMNVCLHGLHDAATGETHITVRVRAFDAALAAKLLN